MKKRTIIHYIANYFFAKEMRYKPLKRLENNEGVKLTWGELRAYDNLANYTNWLMSMINYSQEINVDFHHMMELIRDGIIKGLEWNNEQDFIEIYFSALNRQNGEEIPNTILAHNAYQLDK